MNEQGRRIWQKVRNASWRDSWLREMGKRPELWSEADEARMDVIGANGPTGEHYDNEESEDDTKHRAD